jgi:putative autoinducer-2 (AI-2) aldolase
MGRNIWQSDHPVAMIKAVRTIVHGNSNVEQAYDYYKKLVSEGPKMTNKSKKPTQDKSKKPTQTKK